MSLHEVVAGSGWIFDHDYPILQCANSSIALYCSDPARAVLAMLMLYRSHMEQGIIVPPSQENTLPVPPKPASPPTLARGLALPFSYSHLLFSPTLALLLFVGVPMLPTASNSAVVIGELSVD